jgi:hypothetical protein
MTTASNKKAIERLQKKIIYLNEGEQSELDSMIPQDVKAAMELVSSRYTALRNEVQNDIDKIQLLIDFDQNDERQK